MYPTSRKSTRPRLAATFVVLAAYLSGANTASAQGGKAPGPQEKKRRELLDKLGLEKKDQPKPAPPVAEPETDPAATTPTAPTDTPAAAGTPAPAGTPVPNPTGATSATPTPAIPFARIHGLLLTSCRPCHAEGGAAATSKLLLQGDARADHATTRRFVTPASPRRSLLLTKAAGTQHGGGVTLPPASEPLRRIQQWIAAGAVFVDHPASPGAAAAGAVTTTPLPAAGRAHAGTTVRKAPPPAALPPALAADVSPPAGPAGVTATAHIGATAGVPPPAVSTATPRTDAPPPAVATSFHAELSRACAPCHAVGLSAGHTRLLLSGQLVSDLSIARLFVAPAAPAQSPLRTKAEGAEHGGGISLPAGSAGHRALVAWIEAGAPTGAPAPPSADPAATTPSPAPAQADASHTPTPSHTRTPTPTPVPVHAPAPTGAPAGHGGGLRLDALWTGLALNGRFDLNLERRAFRANPFDGDAQTALKSYHHFLFLSREAQGDPIGFNAEIINLEFWEAHGRVSPASWRTRVLLRAGKILVPFGTEPLFHQSYGGHAGFDQRVLPAIWASEGLAASLSRRLGGFVLSGDLYSVRGHRLKKEDGVLSLQSDLSSGDEIQVATGARAGLAWGPLAATYSAYVNPLGFGRLLYLQAADVGLWRWRGIPVIDRLVLGLGLLRGDVSGGGPGRDHYHFASYWHARAYVRDWLYVQYRQGLRTIDNRRGVIIDTKRLDRADGSTHNVGVVGRYRNLQMGLYYFLNFEKAGEVNDDLLRLMVSYEL